MLVTVDDKIYYQEMDPQTTVAMAKTVHEGNDEFKKGKNEKENQLEFGKRMKNGVDAIMANIVERMHVEPHVYVGFWPQSNGKNYMCRITIILTINNENDDEEKEPKQRVLVAAKISSSNYWRDENSDYCVFHDNGRKYILDKLKESFKLRTNFNMTAELNLFFLMFLLLLELVQG